MKLRSLFSFFLNLVLLTITILAFTRVREFHLQFENKKAVTTGEIIKNLEIRESEFYKDNKYYRNFSKKYFSFGEKSESAFNPYSQLYYIQVATFLDVKNAIEFLKRKENFDLRVVEVNKNDKKYYIIISNYFETKDEALDFSKNFKKYSPILRVR